MSRPATWNASFRTAIAYCWPATTTPRGTWSTAVAAAEMQTDVVLISGGNDGVEERHRGTYGNVQVYVRAGGRDVTAPLDRCATLKSPRRLTDPRAKKVVSRRPQPAAQLVFTNMAVASAMCNALLRLLMPRDRDPLYDEVSLDVFDATCLPHWFSPTPSA